MAKVLSYIESVSVVDSNGLQSWVGRAGDDVPDWVLGVTSSPRAFDLDTPTAAAASTFPSLFPETF